MSLKYADLIYIVNMLTISEENLDITKHKNTAISNTKIQQGKNNI